MKYSIYVLIFVMVVAVGCMNENPVTTDTGNSPPELIPEAPKTVPFNLSLATTFTPPAPIGGGVFEFTIFYTGNATHMGEVSGVGDSQVCFAPLCEGFGPFGTQTAEVVFTDGEGNTISMFSSGWTGDPPTPPNDASFTGTWIITGGTGRFSGVSGAGTYAGEANTTEFVGQVDYQGVISR